MTRSFDELVFESCAGSGLYHIMRAFLESGELTRNEMVLLFEAASHREANDDQIGARAADDVAEDQSA